jgi:hypothetical protein
MLATITHIQGDILVEESEGITHDRFMKGGEEVAKDFADGIGETSTCTTGETKRYAGEKKKGKTSWRLRESEDIVHTEEELSADVNADGRGAIPTR